MRRALVPGARVLVRLPSWLGDCVMAEPVIRALLERRFELTLVGPARFGAALGWTKDSRAHFVDLARGATPRLADWRGHDVALLLDGSLRSALAAARAGIPERVGWASGGRSWLLTQAVRPALERGHVPLGLGLAGGGARRLPRPFSSACVELAALLGLEVREREPRLVPTNDALDRVARRLAALGIDARRRCVLVHAGGRAESAKAVPVETWSAILLRLRRRSELPVVLVCAPGEEDGARRLAAALRGTHLLDDPPLDVVETAAAHRFAAVVLASDGGSVHLARAAARVPIVVLFGPTDPRHTADGAACVRVERVQVECGPCHRERCPLPPQDRQQCLGLLDPERIAGHAVELAARTA